MARLTVATLINEITDSIPSIAQQKIVRAANKVLLRIHNETNVPQYSTFTTLPKVETGTVNVTQGSTTAEFSATPIATTDPILLIQIEGDSSWFKLTPVDTNTGTLSSAWAEATDTTATYCIVAPTITFSYEVGELLRLWRPGERDLTFATSRAMNYPAMGDLLTGSPTSWSPYQHDSSAATPNNERLRIMLTPAPDERLVYQFMYRTRPTLLDPGGATSQEFPILNLWNETLVAGTLFWLWDGRDPERAPAWRQRYEDAFLRARGADAPAGVIGPRVRRTSLAGREGTPEYG